MNYVIILANILVGASIGLSGIGGFFLPIIYTAVLGMAMPPALTLSFSAFVVSGLIAAVSFVKRGYYRKAFVVPLALGCLAGAVAGSRMNAVLPVNLIKTMLYLVVLFSGSYMLIRKSNGDSGEELPPGHILNRSGFALVLGMVVGTLGSLTGAGGAFLLVPVLAGLGERTHYAVGMGILGNIFISVPASVLYLTRVSMEGITGLLILVLITHGLGTWGGSLLVPRVSQVHLKRGVGWLSVLSSLFLLIRLWL